ncbi:MAG: hypothetical protein V3U44_07695 [Alphaproteobacteria bacterium]
MPRSKFQPGEDQREAVLLMAGHGMPEDAIAKVMKITPAALRRHFPNELSTARTIANSKVAETAYQLATSGKAPAVTMFWLKTRAGWRDRADLADGEGEAAPAPPGFDLSKLSDTELDQLEKLMEKARPESINKTTKTTTSGTPAHRAGKGRTPSG